MAQLLDNDPFAAKNAIVRTEQQTTYRQQRQATTLEERKVLLQQYSKPKRGPNQTSMPEVEKQLTAREAEGIEKFCAKHVCVAANSVATRLIQKRISMHGASQSEYVVTHCAMKLTLLSDQNLL